MEKKIEQYLHYYIGQKLERGGVITHSLLEAANNTAFDAYSDFKPLLSKLEDMSYEDFMQATSIHIQAGGQLLLTLADIKIDPKPRPIYPEVFHYLLKKGYWLFGNEWFDEGLIIDKKTLVKV